MCNKINNAMSGRPTSIVAAVLFSLICNLQIIEAQKIIRRPVAHAATGAFDQQSVYEGYRTSSEVIEQQLPARPIKHYNWSQNYNSSSYRVSRLRPAPFYQQQEAQYLSLARANAEPASYVSVNGRPGLDFPSYTRVPKTSFTCEGLPYDYGMYADEETGCQAYHVCYNGRKDSFLCGPETVFNQRILHCDHRYSTDCSKSSLYYSSNAYMGSSQPEPGPAQASTLIQGQKKSASSLYSRYINRPAPPPGSFKHSLPFSQTQQV